MRDDIKSTGRRGNGSTRARANGRICVRGGTTGLGWVRLGWAGLSCWGILHSKQRQAGVTMADMALGCMSRGV